MAYDEDTKKKWKDKKKADDKGGKKNGPVEEGLKHKKYKSGAEWDKIADERRAAIARREIEAAGIPELDARGFYKKKSDDKKD